MDSGNSIWVYERLSIVPTNPFLLSSRRTLYHFLYITYRVLDIFMGHKGAWTQFEGQHSTEVIKIQELLVIHIFK